jgi:RNA polymerase sigma factor (TIGR02999 family)
MAAQKSQGDQFEVVYDDLRQIAKRQISHGDTLNTTALVHELYLRMANRQDIQFADQKSFFHYAARAMRHLLVDRARTRLREKRGGGARVSSIDDSAANEVFFQIDEALELDSVLQRLEIEDERAAQVVELYYFAGLPLEKIAQTLGLTRRTIDRDLEFARAFMKAHWRG